MNNNIIAICIAKNYLESTNDVYDEDIINIIITYENENNKNRIRNVYNIENYVEVPSLSSESFKSHFRYVINIIIIITVLL